MNHLNILYLYAELVGYQIPLFRIYTQNYDAKVNVVSWDKKKLKPYEPPQMKDVVFHNRSKFDKHQLLEFCKGINPDIVYVSGWMDKGYLYVTKKLKKMGIPIVTGFDDIWTGSIRQRIGSFIFPFFFKKYFSHAWVAGPYQFEFAKRMGFTNGNIIFDLLTADTKTFKSCMEESVGSDSVPKAFLYVGNFREVKGTDILFEAYKEYRNNLQGNWKLICVGNGQMENMLRQDASIETIPFSSAEELIKISKRARVFILPSRHDQWGVVVHEFAALGMPFILSENVGARATFFIEGYNGLSFKHGSPQSLAEKMLQFSNIEDEKLRKMGENSRSLSTRINIETSAANFVSLLKR